MGCDLNPLLAGFVVVGTAGQTATNPGACLYSSFNPIIHKILVQTMMGSWRRVTPLGFSPVGFRFFYHNVTPPGLAASTQALLSFEP